MSENGPDNLYISTDIENAIIQGEKATFDKLIDDADLTHRADNGSTLLHQAAISGRLEMARELLDRGIDLDAQNDGGITPLLLALKVEEYDTAEMLLDAGADPNILDNRDRSPLMMAFMKGTEGRECMKQLLEHGADPTLSDASGRDPVDCVLEWARELGKTDAVELMESYV
ncbi:ankyrin repeat domain-containing protein [Halovivax cerinus]|uniref:Ankyrin repeat domain-containing protein n=1 Tax=Halovivax cerinus TaxID=1487865 RepID=A0ABD5NRS2_9EURY|nr:ankyrin repeat domain-containing protein [Halovivax cerinus]